MSTTKSRIDSLPPPFSSIVLSFEKSCMTGQQRVISDYFFKLTFQLVINLWTLHSNREDIPLWNYLFKNLHIMEPNGFHNKISITKHTHTHTKPDLYDNPRGRKHYVFSPEIICDLSLQLWSDIIQRTGNLPKVHFSVYKHWEKKVVWLHLKCCSALSVKLWGQRSTKREGAPVHSAWVCGGMMCWHAFLCVCTCVCIKETE